jgi:hypothetical protein
MRRFHVVGSPSLRAAVLSENPVIESSGMRAQVCS